MTTTAVRPLDGHTPMMQQYRIGLKDSWLLGSGGVEKYGLRQTLRQIIHPAFTPLIGEAVRDTMHPW